MSIAVKSEEPLWPRGGPLDKPDLDSISVQSELFRCSDLNECLELHYICFFSSSCTGQK